MIIIQLEIILNYRDLILNFRSLISKLFVMSLKINGILIIKTELKMISNYRDTIQKKIIIGSHFKKKLKL